MNSPNPSDKETPTLESGFTNMRFRCAGSLRGKRFQSGQSGSEKKKKMERGRGGKKRSPPSLPFPSPVIPFFCSRPNFLDELARKRLLRRLVSRVHWVRVDGRPIRIKKVCGFRSIRIPACGRGPVTQSVLQLFLLKSTIRTESIRNFSNFNFQWTKTLYQNNLNNIAFFFTLFKGYRCNQLSVRQFLKGQEKINVMFHTKCENTDKILKISCVRCHFVKFEICFQGPYKKFSLVLLQITNYIYSS